MAQAQRRVYAPADGYDGGYRDDDAPPPFVRERARRPAPARKEVDMGRTKYPTILIALIVLATASYVVWTFSGGDAENTDAPVIPAQTTDFKSAYEGGVEDEPVTAEIDQALVGQAPVARAPAKSRPIAEEPIAARPVAPAPAAGAPVFAAAGPFVAQIASLKSADAADAAWTRFSRRSPALFQNARKDIQQADLGERGVYFRVRAGYFASRADAAQFCGQVKALGQECLVVGK